MADLFESCVADLRRGRTEAARLRWNSLRASLSAGLEPGQLDALRRALCQRLELDSGPSSMGSLGEADEATRLAMAEAVLRIDPGNREARCFAIGLYSDQLRRGLQGLRLDRGNRRRATGQRRRLGNRLRCTARRLRRYLTVMARTPYRVRPQVVGAFLVISQYFESVQEHDLAVKMARRAKRLDPRDGLVRDWLRRLRRRRRR